MPHIANWYGGGYVSDDWETPGWLLDIAFPDGKYYDPCPIGGKGGLGGVWPTDVPVFVNPPYSKPGPWVKKASEHRGAVRLLLPCDPTTDWWAYSRFFRVSFIDIRVKFWSRGNVAGQRRLIGGGEDSVAVLAPFRRSMGTGTFAVCWWSKDPLGSSIPSPEMGRDTIHATP